MWQEQGTPSCVEIPPTVRFDRNNGSLGHYLCSVRPEDLEPLLSLDSRALTAHSQAPLRREVTVQPLLCCSGVETPPRMGIRRLIHQHNAGEAAGPSQIKGKCKACARTHTHTQSQLREL